MDTNLGGGKPVYISVVKSLSELHREKAKSLYNAVIHLTSLRNDLGGKNQSIKFNLDFSCNVFILNLSTDLIFSFFSIDSR